jgi:hypothetical protein
MSLAAFDYCRHIENEMPLTINHGGEMSTISDNDCELNSFGCEGL